MNEIGLFTICDDILDIIKSNYWKIKHKTVISEFTSEWMKRRPFYILTSMCRKVHEGRVFLKEVDVGPLIEGFIEDWQICEPPYSVHIKNNKYINGHQLHDIIQFKFHPIYKQVRYGLGFSQESMKLIEDMKKPDWTFKDKVKYLINLDTKFEEIK